MWFFYALVLALLYISYLCTYLSMDEVNAPFSNSDDLFQQNSVKYGWKNGGSTMKYFEKTPSNTSHKAAVTTKSVEEGIHRVLNGKGKYAFFMENAAIEYNTQRNCELEEVGRTLDQKGYGIAMSLSNHIMVIKL